MVIGKYDWEIISEKMNKKGFVKSPKQCKERWINVVNPEITKLNWKCEDNEKLFLLHQKNGSSWKLINKEFEGRTESFLKNKFFSLIRKAFRRIRIYLNIPSSILL